MAISNKPLSLSLLIAFTTIFLMVLKRVDSKDVVSFAYNDFSANKDHLIFQGDSHVTSSHVLQLTKTDTAGVPQPYSVGRTLYSEEVHMWEESTNRMSTFETTITFNLTSPTPETPADGFTFFIAPSESTIPDASYGGYLGLFDPKTALDDDTNNKNQVFAVEFDTHSNSWDPNYIHIGIDVNSIKSVQSVEWDRKEGEIGNVRIDYNSATKNLTVFSSYPGTQTYTVSYIVNLKNVLPEWVRVGLSASTGVQTQVHNIHSWDFTSTLIHTSANKEEEDMYIAQVV